MRLGPCELVERAALLLLLALIPLRAVIAETHTFEMVRWLRGLPASAGTQPGTTFVIVALIVATTAAVCCVRLWTGTRRYRWTGAELGAALLVIAAVISTWRAGQKHLAVIGVLDFLGMVLYMLTLRQLLLRPWHIRLALTVILGTGAVIVTKCVYQHWSELPDTIEYYEEHKAEWIEDRPDMADGSRTAGQLHDFEQRLRSGSVTGYFAHPNVLGSHLILVVMAALAVAGSRFRRRPAWFLAVPLLIAATGVAAMFLARSKGAIAACGVALLVWLVGQWASTRKRGSAIRNPTWLALWLAVIVAGVALVGVLRSDPHALGRSMLFRSMYWQGAWDMLRDQGPWGVGANNFGRFFPRYKSAECPEEVESPHSWIVQSATEWGIVGMAGLLLLFVGVSRKLAEPEAPGLGPRAPDLGRGVAADPGVGQGAPDLGRGVASGPGAGQGAPDLGRGVASGPGAGQGAPSLGRGVASSPGVRSSADLPPDQGRGLLEARGGSIVLWTAGIGVIVFGWQAWLLSGNEPGFVALSLLLVALPWAFGAIASSMEGTEATEFLDDAPGPMLAGLCAGLIGFMLHTGIDLAMFWPGAATGFFAMMAIALAVRECSSRSRDANGVEAAPGIARRWSSDTAAGEPAPGLEATPRPRHRLDTSRLCGSGAPVGSNRRVACLAIGAGGIAFVLLLLILLVRPTASVGKFLQDGRLGVEALAAELIRRLSNVERDDSVAGIIEDLHRRDPANSATWRQIGALLSKRIEPNRDPARFHQQAISGIRQAVARYAMSWSAYVSSPSYDSYRDAIQCYRLDGTAAEELADELSRRVSSVEQVDQVVGRVEGFERRDPANTIVRHQFATLYYQRFAIGGDVADLERSIASMRQAVAGYPTSPTKHLLLADLLEKLAAVTDSIDARRSAAADLQAALDLDAKRIYVSKPHRFTDEMRGEIGRRIERLLRGQSATTNPVRSTTRDS